MSGAEFGAPGPAAAGRGFTDAKRARAVLLLRGQLPSAVEVASPLRAHQNEGFQLTESWLRLAMLSLEEIESDLCEPIRFGGVLRAHGYTAGRPARRQRRLSALARAEKRVAFCEEVTRGLRRLETVAVQLDPVARAYPRAYVVHILDPLTSTPANGYRADRCRVQTILVVLHPVARVAYWFDPAGERSPVKCLRQLVIASACAAPSIGVPNMRAWRSAELPVVSHALAGRGGAADGELLEYTGYRVPAAVWVVWALFHWRSRSALERLRRAVTDPQRCLADVEGFAMLTHSLITSFLLQFISAEDTNATATRDGE